MIARHSRQKDLLPVIMMRLSTILIAMVFFILAAGPYSSVFGAEKGVETITYVPQTFDFEVHPQGGYSGNNNVTFSISRVEKPRGPFGRCIQVKSIHIYHLEPWSVGQDPNDYDFATRELPRPLCNFQNFKITGQPFRKQDIESVCFEVPRSANPVAPVPNGPPVFRPGTTAALEKRFIVDFEDRLQVYGNQVLNKIINLRANISCIDNTASGQTAESYGQEDIIPPGQSTGASSGGRNWTPSGTASGADFSGRQFTPVDRRTTPVTPMGTGTTRPEVVPRDPGTRPQSSPGSGSRMPDFTPRTPGSKPGAAGPPPLPEPACNMNGIWRVAFGQNLNIHWNFSEIDTGRYEVTTENLGNNDPPPLPFGSGNSACIKPTAILSGSRLLFFSCGEHSASFFEGTVDGSCYKVNGRHYSTSGHVIPATLTRSRNLRIPVPGSKP